jgi:hypothetical protein
MPDANKPTAAPTTGLPTLTIITAASESYGDLARGLVRSIRDAEAQAGRTEPLPLHVLDLGLSEQTVALLAPDCHVLEGRDLPLPTERTDFPREYLLSRAVKPLLRERCPGYGVYLWLDSDAWVQHWWALELLWRTGAAAGLTAVPEMDRCYLPLYQKDAPHYKAHFLWTAEALGQAAAQEVNYRPVINCGVWAARADSPLWERWQHHLTATFHAGRTQVTDQASFNLTIYGDRVAFCPLPSRYNWLCCHALPRFQCETGRLTEPLPPYQELGIIHLTAKYCNVDLPVLWSTGIRKPLRLDYLGLRSAAEAEKALHPRS